MYGDELQNIVDTNDSMDSLLPVDAPAEDTPKRGRGRPVSIIAENHLLLTVIQR